MKKLGFAIIAAAVLALPLCAQVTTVRADIPFQFAVGNTTLAPGQYAIALQNGSQVAHLEGSRGLYFASNPAGPYIKWQDAKLVFHRYGDQYFLSRISAGWTSRDIPLSRMERELRKTGATGQMQTEIVLATR